MLTSGGEISVVGTIGIKLDSTTRERLKALGELRNRSPHWLMKTAIAEYLDQHEQIAKEAHEDLERWERYKLSGKAIPHEAVADWLGRLAEGKAAACPQ